MYPLAWIENYFHEYREKLNRSIFRICLLILFLAHYCVISNMLHHTCHTHHMYYLLNALSLSIIVYLLNCVIFIHPMGKHWILFNVFTTSFFNFWIRAAVINLRARIYYYCDTNEINDTLQHKSRQVPVFSENCMLECVTI